MKLADYIIPDLNCNKLINGTTFLLIIILVLILSAYVLTSKLLYKHLELDSTIFPNFVMLFIIVSTINFSLDYFLISHSKIYYFLKKKLF